MSRSAGEKSIANTETPFGILFVYATSCGSVRAHAIQMARMSAALARRGARVRLHIRRSRTDPQTWFRMLGVPMEAGLEVAPVPWNRLALSLRLSRFARECEGDGRHPVLYLREARRYAVGLARRARCRGVGVIYEAHKVESGAGAGPQGHGPGRAWDDCERALLRLADGVVCISPIIEESLRRKAPRSLPFCVAPSAAAVPSTGQDDDMATVDSTAESRSTGGASGRDIEIIYAGQLAAWKGVSLLLRAMGHLPHRRLTIAGGADPGLLEQLGAEARRIGVADRVDFLGQVPPREVAALIARAVVGVVPLDPAGSDEGLLYTSPLKVFEYFSLGAGVVSTDVPAMRSILGDCGTGLLVAADQRGLAEGIERMLSDAPLRERLVARARRLAAGWTWDHRARAILAFLEDVSSDA